MNTDDALKAQLEHTPEGELLRADDLQIVRRYESPYLTLIDKAMDKGVGADEIGKFLDIQKDWEAGEARKAFAAAMVACQSEIPTILTDAENPKTRSRFARLETIVSVVKPVYVRHGFAPSFSTEKSELPGHYCVVCDVRHRRGHTERFRADVPMDGIGPQGNPIGGMNAPQAAGSTLSYGRRYLLGMIFNLTIADEDTDAAGSAELVGEDEAAELKAKLEAAGWNGVRFFSWASVHAKRQVTRFADLPVSTYKAALAMLSGRGGNGNGGGK